MADSVSVWPESSVIGVADGGAVETAVLTSVGIFTTAQQPKVLITGMINVVAGTAATQLITKVRRGNSVSGPEIGTLLTDTVVDGDSYVLPLHVEDVPGESAGLQYTLTVTETSATADGSVSVATMSITTHS